MATLCRSGSRAFGAVLRNQSVQGSRRGISTRSNVKQFKNPLLLGAVAVGAGYNIFQHYKNRLPELTLPDVEISFPGVVHAATQKCQPSVISGTKKHALYMWIHLSQSADVKQCTRVAANLQKHVDAVCPPDMRDEEDEVLAGVGFGPAFYAKAAGRSFFGLFQVAGKTKKDYSYKTKAGPLGEMPSEGGDIFFHAKSNEISKLFELAQKILDEMPEGSVAKFHDTYGWVFKNGRDLTGFIDGTENAADDEERAEVAIENGTGGSYVITQRWIHNLSKIKRSKDAELEHFVGRQIDDSTELKDKAITSHVARMTGGKDFEQPKAHRIVRQSQPYGGLKDKAGLFFIAYTADPAALNYMLDRMVGQGKEDQHSDDMMRLSTCEASTYWYFPGEDELKNMK